MKCTYNKVINKRIDKLANKNVKYPVGIARGNFARQARVHFSFNKLRITVLVDIYLLKSVFFKHFKPMFRLRQNFRDSFLFVVIIV